MLKFIMTNTPNNSMYTARELHIFHNDLELNYKSFYLNVILSHQYFHCILQLIYQLTFFFTYNFHNLNILQHHMIYHIHNNNY